LTRIDLVQLTYFEVQQSLTWGSESIQAWVFHMAQVLQTQ
jgi:hypothetical protein